MKAARDDERRARRSLRVGGPRRSVRRGHCHGVPTLSVASLAVPVRLLTSDDLERVLAINEGAVPAVGSLDERDLEDINRRLRG